MQGFCSAYGPDGVDPPPLRMSAGGPQWRGQAFLNGAGGGAVLNALLVGYWNIFLSHVGWGGGAPQWLGHWWTPSPLSKSLDPALDIPNGEPGGRGGRTPPPFVKKLHKIT